MKLRIDLDGKTYDLDVEVLEEDRPAPRPGYLPPHAPPMTVRSSAGPAAADTSGASAAEDAPVDEEKVCRSPLSGVVNRIAVKIGQELKQDDLIMVLEAMKMETNVVAGHPGTVKALRVAEGDGVKTGQILMDYA
ncbi:acetyl-CoA carboxylase biotin carboxyl carrier protein subunit [uncultured Rhodospira sp.]|uniref:acetyl-CoA carboxylase biotin carboxyl carrier protein n=1 Tax=uncultured Rhodospira sp. TaxID=1936189 RepID=UPI002630FAD6|nr:acetyl-CoA carboxylase biotin carboxyl carrier protein subunit [uncultured Rhodospira sp.]